MSKNSKNTRKQKATERKKQRQREEQQYQESISRFFRKSEKPPRRSEPKGAAPKKAKEKPLPANDTGKGTAPSTWGGRREGAGRKKADDDFPRRHYSLYCNEEERDFLRFALKELRVWKDIGEGTDKELEYLDMPFKRVIEEFIPARGL